jgi:hypothetical protein
MFAKILSGGQTGVDRAALDVALALGLPCGGWCPKGRRAEDGTISEHYPLVEAEVDEYAHRTELNVLHADGTLVLTNGPPTGGTALTIELARKHGKPCLVLDLAGHPAPGLVHDWAQREDVGVLNVAGPRASTSRGIYFQASRFLRLLLAPVLAPG